jgi:hypothetical protein
MTQPSARLQQSSDRVKENYMNVAEKNLRRGATILAIAAIAILGATIAILSNKPDPRS